MVIESCRSQLKYKLSYVALINNVLILIILAKVIDHHLLLSVIVNQYFLLRNARVTEMNLASELCTNHDLCLNLLYHLKVLSVFIYASGKMFEG